MSAIEDRVAVLEYRLKELEQKVAAGGTAGAHASGGGGVARGAIASDYDLDSQFGDPVVKKDPKRWTGDSFAGCRMSECSADFLDCLAEFCEWAADQDDAKGKTWTSNKPGAKPVPASTFNRKDAARARGWAKRLRAGTHRLPTPAAASDADDGFGASASGFAEDPDSIPFIFSADVTPRHLRRRTLWERF